MMDYRVIFFQLKPMLETSRKVPMCF